MNYNFKFNLEKRICDVILVCILIGCYFVLTAINVSPKKFLFKTENKEIDWNLFQVKPSQTLLNNNIAAPTNSNKKKASQSVDVIIPNLEVLDIQLSTKIDLTQKNMGAIDVPLTTDIDNKINVVSIEELPEIKGAIFENANYQFHINNNTPSNYEIEGPAIDVNSPPNLNTRFPANRFENKKELKEISKDKAIPEPEVIKIELRPEDLKEEDKDISPIIHELIVWMKQNPSSFSNVFKKFMNYEPDNLTSHARFKVNTTYYELFLLCKVNILEIRICLIESKKLTLLIDSGLKEKSNYLRSGSVKRSQDGSISSFFSRQETPSPERTEKFYKIFLSWWNQIKNTPKFRSK